MTNKLSPFQQTLELCKISGVVLLPFSFFIKQRISKIDSWCILDVTCSKIPSQPLGFFMSSVILAVRVSSNLHFNSVPIPSFDIHNTPMFTICGYMYAHIYGYI